MFKKDRFLLSALSVFFIFSSLNYASEVMVPATQVTVGSGTLSLYYSKLSKTLNFHTASIDEIKLGNGNSYLSDVSNVIETTAECNSMVLKYLINPQKGLNYWIKAGAGSYELEFPSSSVKNHLSGRDKGWILGVGLRKLLFPDTIVSPAIAYELGFDHSQYDMDTFRSGSDAPILTNNKFEQTEIQAVLNVSKKFKMIEAYGGAKLQRTYVSLWNKGLAGTVSGYKDNIGLYLGSKLKISETEGIALELSGFSETGFSIGWNVMF